MKNGVVKFLVSILIIFSMVLAFTLPVLAALGSDYGKSTISEDDVLYVYELLYSGVAVSETPVAKINFDNLRSISKEELAKGVSLFISDHPECFWFRNYYSYTPMGARVISISPKYSFEGEALVKAKADFNAAVDEIMSRLPDSSNYDKALYLHDEIARRVTYEEVGEHQTAYGALVSGKAVCAGYAAAYQMLLEMAGITAWTVTGSSRGVAHAWNVVWLDEETCVYTDVTWDDGGDEIFHAYFNLDRAEMEEDHTTDADTFLLPSCDHDGESYLDLNYEKFDERTTVAQMAAVFGPTIENTRSAVICYTGKNIVEWMNANGLALYKALGGIGNSASYTRAVLGKEVHLTLVGNFPPMTYKLNVAGGAGMSSYSELEQYVVRGEEMTDIIFSADDGYYFPENYAVDTYEGISVERIDAKRIRVFGIPTADDISITLPSASAMTAEDTPNVSFTALGWDFGKLFGVEAGMVYSFDGLRWYEIGSDGNMLISNLRAGNILIKKQGNGESTLVSSIQTISIGRALIPTTLDVIQPSEPDGKGIIGTSNIHEYSSDGENWIDCEGSLCLYEGTYFIRVKASGIYLASNSKQITLKYVAPTEEPTEVSTELPTETSTEVPTETSTETPTEASTETSTETPSEVSTETSTETPTELPTETSTEIPTEISTEIPTETPTETVTELPTETPTETVTELPTETSTETPTEMTAEITTETTHSPTVSEEEKTEHTASETAAGVTLEDTGKGTDMETATETTIETVETKDESQKPIKAPANNNVLSCGLTFGGTATVAVAVAVCLAFVKKKENE